MYLVWTSDKGRKVAFSFILPLDHSLNNGRMVGSEIDKDMSDASLWHRSVSLARGRALDASLTSQIASKKAVEAVYL